MPNKLSRMPLYALGQPVLYLRRFALADGRTHTLALKCTVRKMQWIEDESTPWGRWLYWVDGFEVWTTTAPETAVILILHTYRAIADYMEVCQEVELCPLPHACT